jgi:hypothetical protein
MMFISSVFILSSASTLSWIRFCFVYSSLFNLEGIATVYGFESFTLKVNLRESLASAGLLKPKSTRADMPCSVSYEEGDGTKHLPGPSLKVSSNGLAGRIRSPSWEKGK